jgi:hypothetical protein
MWRNTGRGGTHAAILAAVGVVVMVSFSLVALSTLTITAPIERAAILAAVGVVVMVSFSSVALCTLAITAPIERLV